MLCTPSVSAAQAVFLSGGILCKVIRISTTTNPERLLTRKEAARLLRIGLSTLDYKITEAELPRIRIGKSLRILLTDIYAYVQKKKQEKRTMDKVIADIVGRVIAGNLSYVILSIEFVFHAGSLQR